MTSMDAEIKAAKKEYSCPICFDDDIDSELMCLVDECGHRFCFNCVKQHIEVKLIDRMIPNCLAHRCESQLSLDRCEKLLTRKLSLMWRQKIKEDSTPLQERVYCPHQGCSSMMTKTELLSSLKYSGFRRCLICRRSFCLHCKVPWHGALSCNDYKKFHPNPQNDDDDEVKLKSLANRKGWRQCNNCKYMIERSDGCNYMACRCGDAFCYKCGAKWNRASHSHRCRCEQQVVIYHYNNQVQQVVIYNNNQVPQEIININNEVPLAISLVVLFGVTVIVFVSCQRDVYLDLH